MNELRDRVAVVTGAGSGIGRAMAARFADEGMAVVLADVEGGAAERAASELRAGGARSMGVACDVTRPEAVEALAERTVAEFGACHLLCNNAGVLKFGMLTEASLADWQWLVQVNLFGVVHGLQAFLPRMRAQEGEAHIVNTASFSGLAAGLEAGIGAYTASKFAVVGLTEQLRTELAADGIGVTALCPGMVATRITEAGRNRPDTLGGPEATDERWLDRDRLAHAMDPSAVAGMVVDAVRENRPYVMTHPAETKAVIEMRTQALLEACQTG